MLCVYPNGLAVTKDQIEVFEQVAKVAKVIKDAFSKLREVFTDWWTKLESLMFQIRTPKARSRKLPRSMTHACSIPRQLFLDKRTRMHVIRSNC